MGFNSAFKGLHLKLMTYSRRVGKVEDESLFHQTYKLVDC